MLDIGNAGTGARLLMGLVAAHPFTSIFTGDASLRFAADAPRGRATDADRRAFLRPRRDTSCPWPWSAPQSRWRSTYEVPVASAQVKSAVLLAGLNTQGITTVIEQEATRDHTELMLRAFGAKLEVETLPGGGRSDLADGQAGL